MESAQLLGLMVAGVLVLGIAFAICASVLMAAGQAALVFPKGIDTRQLGLVALSAALAVGLVQLLAMLTMVPTTLVLVVGIEASLMVAAAGVAWLFTKEP
jgi:hypothetical protein